MTQLKDSGDLSELSNSEQSHIYQHYHRSQGSFLYHYKVGITVKMSGKFLTFSAQVTICVYFLVRLTGV